MTAPRATGAKSSLADYSAGAEKSTSKAFFSFFCLISVELVSGRMSFLRTVQCSGPMRARAAVVHRTALAVACGYREPVSFGIGAGRSPRTSRAPWCSRSGRLPRGATSEVGGHGVADRDEVLHRRRAAVGDRVHRHVAIRVKPE